MIYVKDFKDVLITASHDTTVKIWSVEEEVLLINFTGHRREVDKIFYIDDKKLPQSTIISVSKNEKKLIFWSLKNGEKIDVIVEDENIETADIFKNFPKFIFIGLCDGTLKVIF